MSSSAEVTWDALAAKIADTVGVDLLGKDEDHLSTAGIDSLMFAEILLLIEDAGIYLPEDLVASVVTVGDLRAWVENRIAHLD